MDSPAAGSQGATAMELTDGSGAPAPAAAEVAAGQPAPADLHGRVTEALRRLAGPRFNYPPDEEANHFDSQADDGANQEYNDVIGPTKALLERPDTTEREDAADREYDDAKKARQPVDIGIERRSKRVRREGAAAAAGVGATAAAAEGEGRGTTVSVSDATDETDGMGGQGVTGTGAAASGYGALPSAVTGRTVEEVYLPPTTARTTAAAAGVGAPAEAKAGEGHAEQDTRKRKRGTQGGAPIISDLGLGLGGKRHRRHSSSYRRKPL